MMRRQGSQDTTGTVWDAPNQQVVREDSSPPWEEGAGGGGNPDPQTNTDDDADSGSGSELESMTKAEILEPCPRARRVTREQRHDEGGADRRRRGARG